MRNYLQDLLSGAPSSADFFHGSFLNQSDRLSAMKTAAQRPVIPAVLSELGKQNQGVSPEVDRSLSDLQRGRVAVTVTGQQLGVCGGPLLTLYKIASTIKLAEFLEKESGTRVIPLFWLQSEDHDFAEVSKATFFSSAEALREASLRIPADKLGDSVGRLMLDFETCAEIKVLLEQWSDADPEFREIVEDSFCSPGTYAGAMLKLIQRTFAPYGLLVFDPDRRSIKEAYKDFIASSFFRTRSIGRLLQDRAEKIRLAGYALQAVIRPDSPMFFLSHDGRRERLTEDLDGRWTGNNFEISKESLNELLDREPERFTASALMRPVFQDTIFPTCAYVAGPNELKYLVQIKPLYPFFNCPQPLVVPRQHFVVVEERYQKLMNKLGLTLEDTAKTSEQAILGSEKNPDLDSQQIFLPLEDEILSRLSALEPALHKVDVNLKRALEHTSLAVKTNLSKLRSKFEHAVLQKEEASLKQFQRIKNALFPRGHEQERVICFSHYLLRYGRPFLEQVLSSTSPLEGWKTRAIYPGQEL